MRVTSTLFAFSLAVSALSACGTPVDEDMPDAITEEVGTPDGKADGAAKVGWIGAGYSIWNKLSGWVFTLGLPNPYGLRRDNYHSFGSAPTLGVEVWVPGLTDTARDGSAKGRIRAEIYSSFFSGTPGGAPKGCPMNFSVVSGNNYRYEWLPIEFRGQFRVNCTDKMPAAGKYTYRFRVSVDEGKTWRYLGSANFPNAGQTRTFEWTP